MGQQLIIPNSRQRTQILLRNDQRKGARETNLDETGVDEDAGGEGVEDARDDAGGRAVGVVGRTDAEANSNACPCRHIS